jgi:hypothetical protein
MALLVGSVSDLKVDSSLVSDFYEANWPRRIALGSHSFYEWQFKSLPCAVGIDNCVISYDRDKQIIAGVMGLNIRPFSLGGRSVPGAELTTWIVLDSYRSVGAGAKILSHIQATYEVLIGMGISAMAMPVYLRSGFRYLAAIPRYLRVYDFDAIAFLATSEPLALKLSRQWLTAAPPEPYRVTEHAAQESSDLFDRLADQYNFFSRDTRHLRWRYAEHPSFAYRTFLVRPAGSPAAAFVALRKEATIPGVCIYHVTDCIGDDGAMPAAFSFIDDFCRDQGAHIADFFCTAAKINKHALSRGWFSALDDKFFSFPHLFHPVETRTPATTSLIYWAKDNFAEMCDFSRLYVTKQDADFDRPTGGGD